MTDVCVVAPEVALTVTLNVPAGVPVTGGGGGGVEPPHDAIAKTVAISIRSMQAVRTLRFLREALPRNTIPRKPMLAKAASVVPLSGRAEAVERAVVLTVSVVLAALPFGVNVGGLNPQLEAAGSPVQAKLMVPVKPPCGVTEML